MVVGYFASSYWRDHGVLLHGGVAQPQSKKPLNTLYLYTSESKFSEKICLDDKGPCLSHHKSCLIKHGEKEILIVVGGWTGHERSSQVFTFDLNQKTWKILVEDKNRLHRCDPPVGLSGHTATAINSGLICVIGREGGVRIQRKFGQMFFLHLDLDQNQYFYTEAPVLPQSRSGHTTQLAPPFKGYMDLLVFGGRNCGLLDACGKWHVDDVGEIPSTHESLKKKFKLQLLNQMIALRYHAMAVLSSDFFIIHGGRHFKALSSKNVCQDMWVGIRAQPFSKCIVKWHKVQLKNPCRPRFAHTLAIHENEIYAVGGFASEDSKTAECVEKLELE